MGFTLKYIRPLINNLRSQLGVELRTPLHKCDCSTCRAIQGNSLAVLACHAETTAKRFLAEIIVKLAHDRSVEISEQELSVSHRMGRKTDKP